MCLIFRGEIFCSQTRLYPSHACKEYNRHYPGMFQACGYRYHTISQQHHKHHASNFKTVLRICSPISLIILLILFLMWQCLRIALNLYYPERIIFPNWRTFLATWSPRRVGSSGLWLAGSRQEISSMLSPLECFPPLNTSGMPPAHSTLLNRMSALQFLILV